MDIDSKYVKVYVSDELNELIKKFISTKDDNEEWVDVEVLAVCARLFLQERFGNK